MTIADLSIIILALAGLALLRFGVPALVMWLLGQFCCRALHLKT